MLIQPLRYEQALAYRAGTFFAAENPASAYSLSPRLKEAMDNFLFFGAAR
ncbi:MAG: hypothetical protein ABIQ93_00635 [Saprospiraceae bacterium]